MSQCAHRHDNCTSSVLCYFYLLIIPQNHRIGSSQLIQPAIELFVIFRLNLPSEMGNQYSAVVPLKFGGKIVKF